MIPVKVYGLSNLQKLAFNKTRFKFENPRNFFYKLRGLFWVIVLQRIQKNVHN